MCTWRVAVGFPTEGVVERSATRVAPGGMGPGPPTGACALNYGCWRLGCAALNRGLPLVILGVSLNEGLILLTFVAIDSSH